jgi:hypothetical protein
MKRQKSNHAAVTDRDKNRIVRRAERIQPRGNIVRLRWIPELSEERGYALGVLTPSWSYLDRCH